MQRLAGRAQAIDMRAFETLSADRLWHELLPVAVQFVQESRALVAEVSGCCAAPGGEAQGEIALPEEADVRSSFQFEHALDAAVEASQGSLRAVEDIAFLVQLELRQRDDRLRVLTAAASPLALVGECDGALRRICKGLGAIDASVAQATGAPPRLNFSPELEASLRVREAYARFRARVRAEHPSRPEEIHARMRAVGIHIAVLVGWTAYPLLRIRDRLQLRELQIRILDWLRPEFRDDAKAGTRILEDTFAFVEMLTQVSQRQELVQHDRQLVSQALAHLRAVGRLDPSVRKLLVSLQGLDDEADRLLQEPGGADAEAWQATLQRLSDRFGLDGPDAGTAHGS